MRYSTPTATPEEKKSSTSRISSCFPAQRAVRRKPAALNIFNDRKTFETFHSNDIPDAQAQAKQAVGFRRTLQFKHDTNKGIGRRHLELCTFHVHWSTPMLFMWRIGTMSMSILSALSVTISWSSSSSISSWEVTGYAKISGLILVRISESRWRWLRPRDRDERDPGMYLPGPPWLLLVPNPYLRSMSFELWPSVVTVENGSWIGSQGRTSLIKRASTLAAPTGNFPGGTLARCASLTTSVFTLFFLIMDLLSSHTLPLLSKFFLVFDIYTLLGFCADAYRMSSFSAILTFDFGAICLSKPFLETMTTSTVSAGLDITAGWICFTLTFGLLVWKGDVGWSAFDGWVDGFNEPLYTFGPFASKLSSAFLLFIFSISPSVDVGGEGKSNDDDSYDDDVYS